MRPGGRRTISQAAVVSVVAHIALLVALALHAPRLRVPPPERGPPLAVIPILIMPRTPPPAATPGARPAPIRLHQRSLRAPLPETPLKPLVIPTQEPARPAPVAPPKTVAPPPPDPVAAKATTALRGLVGCANPNLLSREERQRCEDRLAAGARQADYLGTGIEAGKATGLAAAAARREADFNYKHGVKPSAPAQHQLPWDTERAAPGSSQAEALGRSLGNDKPVASIPF